MDKIIKIRGGKILLLTNIVSLLVLAYVVKTSGYAYKLKVSLGFVEKPLPPDYWAVKGWENTMLKLNYKADVVFLGNSITYGGDFGKAFPDKKVVNLGYPGDNIDGMMRRIETVKGVNPDKVFLMAGINGLRDMDIDTFRKKYGSLLDSLISAVPDAEIYVQSILPVNKSKEKSYGKNSKISEANIAISEIAARRHCRYIDLNKLYVKNGELPEGMTVDGIHLTSKSYDKWYKEIRKYIY